MSRQILLELVIRTDWNRIDSVRQAVSHCVAAVFGDVELKDSLPMVSAELLENAFKYGLPDEDVTLSLVSDANEVVLTITNAVAAGSRHLPVLKARLSWLMQFGDPFVAYTAALQQVYDGSGPDAPESGLGLVRIYYEGRCRLVCDTSHAGRVSISAKRSRDAAGSGPGS